MGDTFQLEEETYVSRYAGTWSASATAKLLQYRVLQTTF